MLKKTLAITVLLLMLLQGSAFASEAGQIVLIDMVYGAAIGALLGGAIYVFDDDNLDDKLLKGSAIGVVGGFLYGVVEARSFLAMQDGEVKVAAPRFIIEKDTDGVMIKTSLLKISY